MSDEMAAKYDFFVSRRGSVARIAQEVVETLEEKGYRVISQDYDIPIGASFVDKMHEAVKNAVQHAICSSIEIAVKSTRTGIILEVRDNGRGFDPGDLLQGRRGLGLLSMEHYAAEAGLELSILSTRERGTTVRAGASCAPEK